MNDEFICTMISPDAQSEIWVLLFYCLRQRRGDADWIFFNAIQLIRCNVWWCNDNDANEINIPTKSEFWIEHL